MPEETQGLGDAGKALKERGEIASREGPVKQTWSGISSYAENLGYQDEQDFIKELEGKTVLDLGSGLGGLAKSAHMQGVKTRICSVNPTLRFPHSRVEEKAAAREWYGILNSGLNVDYYPREPDWLTKLIDRAKGFERKSFGTAQEYHDQRAVAAFAHALPFLKDSFDLIVDKRAVFGWFISSNTEESVRHKPAFEASIKEMMRVLKPGGRLLVGDIGTFGWVEAGVEPIPSWKEEALREMGLDYEIIWERNRDGKKTMSLGVEIKKH
jgi:SAM-dependent methyltransferase